MFYLSILLAKIANFLIVRLKLGAGYTWPGYVARLLYPDILNEFTHRYSTKYILVSGTNGKTTTAKLITHILSKENYTVVSNKSGANLLNGIVSALLLETHFFKTSTLNYCVLEVDEMVLPEIIKVIEPKVLVLLNLSRDQLDRYGEVDTILDIWQSVLREKKEFSLVLDTLQEEFHKLSDPFKGPVFYFDGDTSLLDKTNLIGDYNAKNLNAAVTVCGIFGIGKERCLHALSDFSVAYGRGEEIDYSGKTFRIFLAKNPNSFNNNLRLLSEATIEYDTLMFVLNDEIRDGRDISWIYDIDPLLLEKVCQNKTIFVSGLRTMDMCTRLVYAGVPSNSLLTTDSLGKIIDDCVSLGTTHKIIVLPNYSAMLEVRKKLTGKEIL